MSTWGMNRVPRFAGRLSYLSRTLEKLRVGSSDHSGKSKTSNTEILLKSRRSINEMRKARLDFLAGTFAQSAVFAKSARTLNSRLSRIRHDNNSINTLHRVSSNSRLARYSSSDFNQSDVPAQKSDAPCVSP